MKGLFILGFSLITFAAHQLSALAQTRQPTNVAQKLVSWQQLSKIVLEAKLEILNTLIPGKLPKGFANGQVAITDINWYHVSYIVAKEGIKLANLSSVGEQAKKHSIQFNAATPNYYNLPSLEVFPTALYKSGKLLEVSNWAAGRDSDSLRKQARQSRQARLSDGRKAYYLKFSD